MIVLGQGVMFNSYFVLYLLSPKAAHRFVGYLEEEAVKTYTNIIKDLDEGNLPRWSKLKPHHEALEYYDLGPNGTFRDVLLSIRADEVVHREVNHRFASIPLDGDMANQEVKVVKSGQEEILKK